ncbi:putative porin [Sunxiuqinia sp. A32]|uniref:putative porin n=1 Tax=Sunxiuqinia sp. A32 TaxID=3461496 RepID=UPI00404547E0
MIRKISITISFLFLMVSFVFSQRDIQEFGSFGSGSNFEEDREQVDDQEEGHDHPGQLIPSIIHSWKLSGYGASIDSAVVDTALNFFHVYNPIHYRSISNTFTGNLGGAYLPNEFFNRETNTDFYFYRSYDAYAIQPADIKYFNTTTPYTLLDYSQSENKNTRTENRFNVFHSQNVNKDLNFTFFYDQAKSMGHYRRQENKNSSLGLYSSYLSDQWLSHFNVMFNRVENQENGGFDPGQDLNEFSDTETYLVKLLNARSSIRNRAIFWNNEYRLGKTIEVVDEDGNVTEKFIPRTGVMHQFEYSGNQRSYIDEDPNLDYYPAIFLDSIATADTVIYNRLTSVFQLKFYEAPDRKYTFSKRAFIGHDRIRITMPLNDSTLVKEKYSNTFVGGGIGREEGKFWQWGGEGKLYLTGYRSGQTELSAFIMKPLQIGNDTMSLKVEGELNTIVPDYFQQKFTSNHYRWRNRFDNTKEMIIRSKISSQKYKLTLGMNYALIGNYIFNNAEALPQQGGREMLVLSAYLNKDIDTKHWLIRGKMIWQKGNQEEYLHLPDITGYLSLSYKTIVSKVLYTQIGADVRYNSAFYADAFDSSTGRFFWQNQQKIGNFPNVDVHANLKLKRTRFFFQWLNATAGLLDGNFWAAPDYPYYRRTFRLGVAWSFYD